MRLRAGLQAQAAMHAQMVGRLSRMVEPAVLYLLASGAAAHGYDLADQANRLGLAETVIDPAAIYRCLRMLEGDACVISSWDTSGPGPARRVYQLTAAGQQRLAGWVGVIGQRAQALGNFVELCHSLGI